MSTIFDLDFGVQVDSVKQPVSATLWVRDARLIVGLLPFMTILITASLSSKCKVGVEVRKFAFEVT